MSLDFIFFFKQKTAYEMRISDWSSDVCSCDLFRTCSLTVDCLRFRLAPASVKLRVRATATKLFSQLGSSITLDIPIYDNSNSGHASLQWHAYRRPGQNEKNPDFVR